MIGRNTGICWKTQKIWLGRQEYAAEHKNMLENTNICWGTQEMWFYDDCGGGDGIVMITDVCMMGGLLMSMCQTYHTDSSSPV